MPAIQGRTIVKLKPTSAEITNEAYEIYVYIFFFNLESQ